MKKENDSEPISLKKLAKVSKQMDANNSYKLANARRALKESGVISELKSDSGSVVEIHDVENGKANIDYWPDASSYIDNLSPSLMPRSFDTEKIGSAVWLLGPERVYDLEPVFEWLGENISQGGTMIIASEIPWPGKFLADDEFAEYTNEEIIGTLTRSGFGEIRDIAISQFVRFWSCTKINSSQNALLSSTSKLLKAGKVEDALTLLNNLNDIQLLPQEIIEVGLLVAEIHKQQFRPEEQLDALENVLKINPESARAYTELGFLAFELGDTDDAFDLFNQALTYEPAFSDALKGRALVFEQKGQMAEAVSSAILSARLKPKDENYAFEIAHLLKNIKPDHKTVDVVSSQKEASLVWL
ncbi:MAG: tetratricopeptide repeat protein [Deltaproteobacteria bacterium]|nr:tetratricopeptide repeat protein [Deltaproteobacteria bacterium]